jgi:hypothetical protein
MQAQRTPWVPAVGDTIRNVKSGNVATIDDRIVDYQGNVRFRLSGQAPLSGWLVEDLLRWYELVGR